ncbi:MAG: M61 family metallopeptidase [bacterium]
MKVQTMTNNLLRAVLTAGLLGLFVAPLIAETPNFGTISYTVGIDETSYEFFRIRIEVSHLPSKTLTLRMPTWSPGAYRIRDYSKNVTNFKAFDKTHALLNVERIGVDSWQVKLQSDYALVEYEVEPAFEFWSGNSLDSTHALVQGPSSLMYLEGFESKPCLIKFEVPDGWGIVSSLNKSDSLNYYAENYPILIDSPALLGRFKRYSFRLNNVPFYLILTGDISFQTEPFLKMVQGICEYQIAFFKEIPFEKYDFFFTFSPRQFGGGLEHGNSTVIGLSSAKVSEDMTRVAEVTAHEFFHAWNVKRIRPKVFSANDYTKQARTKDLWFSEGVTSYYATLTLLRTGIWGESRFLDEMEQEIVRLQMNPDRHHSSVELASWAVWERGFDPSFISYYNKGQILGLLLDLKIRAITNNRFSLDDVMRFMNWWFAKPGVGFAEGDIKRMVNTVSQTDLSGFFEKYVAGTVELPYQEILAAAGLTIDLTSDWVPDIGEFLLVGPRNRVVTVEANSPAEAAGLRRRDYLVQIDDAKVSSLKQAREIVRSKKIGSELHLKVLRNNVELTLPVEVGKKEIVTCEIRHADNPAPLQARIFEGWLKGMTCN